MANKTTHGLSGHPLHAIWRSIKDRCYNPKCTDYNYYGGKGVTMCSEWVDDFKAFYDWATANGWQKGLQIDKDKKNGMCYSPDNCLILTKKENIRIRPTVKLNMALAQEIRNIKLLIPEIFNKEIAIAYGVSNSTVGRIINNRFWV